MIPVSRPVAYNSQELDRMFSPIMQSAWYTNNGQCVKDLECKLTHRLGVPYFVAMSNGTAALEASISFLFKKGSVIAIPSFTFVAVATAVVRSGCTPLFIDIDPNTWTMSYDDYVTACQRNRVDGTVIVNCFGVLPDRRFTTIAVPLVYDNAEGFGVHEGLFGDVDVYSFHATKIVHGAEGGGVACKHDDARWFMDWRNFGFDSTGRISCIGTNAKMSEFHAELVIASLRNENQGVYERRKLLGLYKSRLEGAVQFQTGVPYNCVILTNRRDDLMSTLTANNIDSRPYFYPIHKMPPFKNQSRQLPVTEEVSGKALALPLWAGLPPAMVDHICDVVLEVIA
jgi:dTDP-4-amino-4,6-dideoxygalactose transaminase